MPAATLGNAGDVVALLKVQAFALGPTEKPKRKQAAREPKDF